MLCSSRYALVGETSWRGLEKQVAGEGGWLRVAGSLRTKPWNRSIFDDIGEERATIGCVRGWLRRQGGVWERSSRKSRRGEGRRYVEMDFYRVSERKRGGEARVEVNFVSFIGIPVSYRRTPPRLAPRISRPPPPPRLILTRNETSRRGARSFNIPRWIKRMMNILLFFPFSSSSFTLNVSRSFPLLLPFFSLINFQLLSYFVYIYLYILIIKWVWKFILNQCIRNREISVFTTRNSSHYPARSPVEWRREKWGLSSWRNRVKGRGVKRIEEKRREKGGLIKKNGARRRGKKQHGQPVGVNRGELKGRVGRGVIFAQPIPATLSTVKTWALTTGDHNRAYLFPAPPPLHLVFSRRRCTEGYLPLLLVHPARPPLLPLAISRILSPKLWIDSQRSRERRRDPWKGESGWRLVLLYWNIEWSTKG